MGRDFWGSMIYMAIKGISIHFQTDPGVDRLGQREWSQYRTSVSQLWRPLCLALEGSHHGPRLEYHLPVAQVVWRNDGDQSLSSVSSLPPRLCDGSLQDKTTVKEAGWWERGCLF